MQMTRAGPRGIVSKVAESPGSKHSVRLNLDAQTLATFVNRGTGESRTLRGLQLHAITMKQKH